MIHGINIAQYGETTGQDPFTKQNSKMLKVFLQYGPIKARLGSMVAYQGDAKFEYASSGGVGKWLKKAVTGEGAPLMDVSGTGEVFLADLANEVEILYLDNDWISVNGSNVLAFSASIEWDIQRIGGGSAGMMAGGLFNMTLRGTGYVAVITEGSPVIFDVAASPTFADAQAVVLWTSGVQMNIKTDINLKSFIGKDSGESIQMGFGGQGYVMIQPSEGRLFGTGSAPGGGTSSGGGGLLGALGG